MDRLDRIANELASACPALWLRRNEPLFRHTSFGIGGPAAVLALPSSEAELSVCLGILAGCGEPPVILGSGTNVLAPDEGLDRVVVKTRDLSGVTLLEDGAILADCGLTLTRLAKFAMERGLAGLEFAQGIPGTVGGGIVMNAGAYGGELKQVAVRTDVLRQDGTVEAYAGEKQGFGYRKSVFQDRSDVVVLRAAFRLEPGDREAIRGRMEELAARRRASQPLEFPSAGSTFKRPKTGYAAAMIEQAGLKGTRVGGAMVSEKHAGFVINTGGATAADVKALMELIRQRVFDRFGVWLEPEVRIL